MQFQIRDKFIEQHIPLCLVCVKGFLALTVQKKAVPIVVVLIVGMILFDMRDQTAVPVAKVLSALV